MSSNCAALSGFARGTQDSDGFAFALAADPTPIIEHLVPGKRLTVLAYGGELTVRGGNEKPITPTNVQVDGDTEYGCSAYRPVRVGSEVIFSERASHFDPDVVDAFIEVSPEFAAIAQKYADTDADMQKKIEYLANAIAENAEM